MKSRNGGLIRPSSTRATAHQATASAGREQPPRRNRRHSRLGRWQAHHSTAGTVAARLATALTAPIRRGRSRPGGETSVRVASQDPEEPSARDDGSSTHGASIIGSVPTIDPSVVSTRGER